MKFTLTEHDECFSFDLQAETMEEAATLTRFGMNRTSKINHCSAYANRSGEFHAAIVFKKSKRANNDIPKRP